MGGRAFRAGALLGLGLSAAACTSAPARPPATPPAAARRPPPLAPDPCAGDCRGLAEATVERDPVKGLRLLRACLDCPGSTPSTYARIADLERGRGAPDAALATLRAGTREHPRAALLWQLRGRLALTVGATREGLDALTRARRLRPDDAVLAGEVAEAERRHGDAETKAQRAAEPLLAEASSRFDAGAYDEAASALQEALRSARDAPGLRGEIRRRLALVYVAQDAPKKARAELERGLIEASRPGPVRAALLLTHSDVLLGLGEIETALVSASAAAELTPDDPLPLANVAIARAMRGETKAALAALRKAVDLGLPARLTREDLLAIPGLAKIARRPDFKALVDEGWPAK